MAKAWGQNTTINDPDNDWEAHDTQTDAHSWDNDDSWGSKPAIQQPNFDRVLEPSGWDPDPDIKADANSWDNDDSWGFKSVPQQPNSDTALASSEWKPESDMTSENAFWSFESTRSGTKAKKTKNSFKAKKTKNSLSIWLMKVMTPKSSAPSKEILSAPEKQKSSVTDKKNLSCSHRFLECFAIPIYIHYSWLIMGIISIVMAFRLPGVFGKLFLFLVLFIFTFFSVLVHEMGHILVAKIFVGKIIYASLAPIGGQHLIEHNLGTIGDFLIALSGPVSHIPQIALWFYLSKLAMNGDDISSYFWNWDAPFKASVCLGMLRINMQLLAFNVIVPAWPLDGSVMMTVLLQCCLSLKIIARVMLCLNIPIGIILIIAGFWMNFSISAMTGFWVLYQAFKIRSYLKKDDNLTLYGPFISQSNTTGAGSPCNLLASV